MRRLLLLLTTMALSTATLAVAGVGSAAAKPPHPHPKPKCKCKHGSTGPRGFRGARGPAGPPGPPGPAGPTQLANGVLANNFNADVGPGQAKTVTIGAFTVQEFNDGQGSAPLGGCGPQGPPESVQRGQCGPCGPVTIDAHTQASSYFYTADEQHPNNAMQGPFSNSQSNLIADGDTMSDFTAVLSTASSSVWGIVGVEASGTSCLTSGGLTGD